MERKPRERERDRESLANHNGCGTPMKKTCQSEISQERETRESIARETLLTLSPLLCWRGKRAGRFMFGYIRAKSTDLVR